VKKDADIYIRLRKEFTMKLFALRSAVRKEWSFRLFSGLRS
jgi:hypothetical protein